MNVKDNDRKKNTDLVPIPPEPPAEDSPILLGIPDAEILSFDSGEIHAIEYEDTDSYKITEMFINSREQILKRLLR